MGKKSGSATQRAKKKHEKHQKRKRVLAQRRQSMAVAAARPSPLLVASPFLFPLPPLVQRPSISWDPVLEGIEGLAALTSRSFYEATHTAAHLVCEECGRDDLPAGVWSWVRAARLPTPDILARLEQLGIHADPDDLVAGTPPFGSAVLFARQTWIPLLPASHDVHARDFVCLAACELWKRWRPEPPSQEMLLEPLLFGRYRARHGDNLGAMNQWIQFWSLLRPLLTSEMRTTAAVDVLLGGGGPFFDWASEFAIVASEAALQEQDVDHRAAQVEEELLTQFSEEEESWRLGLAADRAQLLYAMGERDEGERILREQIATYPTSTVAYIALAYLWAPYDSKDRTEIVRALALLEQAAAQPVDDEDEWNLEDSIDDLLEQLDALDEDPPEVAAAV